MPVTDTLMSQLPQGPFARLAGLLGDTKPGKSPINLSIGDPSGTVPAFITEALTKAAASFGNYPAIIGTPEWRGESLRGRTLCVYREQGIGDELMRTVSPSFNETDL